MIAPTLALFLLVLGEIGLWGITIGGSSDEASDIGFRRRLRLVRILHFSQRTAVHRLGNDNFPRRTASA